MTDVATEDHGRQSMVLAERQKTPVMAGGAVSGLVPQSLDEAYRVAQWCAASGLTPSGINTAEKCLYVIMAGADLGLPPVQSLQSFAMINGKLSVWGDAIPALLLSRGFRLREWLENSDPAYPDNMVAKCEITRPEGQIFVGEFSVGDAKEAGLWTKAGPWQTARKRMLKMRARAFTARDGAADLLRGAYVAEEAQDIPAAPEEQAGATGMAARLAARAKPVDVAGFNVNNVAAELTDAEDAEFTDAEEKAASEGNRKPPLAEAVGADVIIDGPAPAGIAYFLANDAVLSEAGRRATFKDGKPFSRQKPSANIPIYREHAPLAEEEKGPQGGALAAGTGSQAAEAAKPASPAGTATAAGTSGTGEPTSAAETDEDGEPSPAKGEMHLLWGEQPNNMGQVGTYRDGKLVGYATPDGARAASMKTYTAEAAGLYPPPKDEGFPGDRPTQTASARAAAAGPATSASVGPASSGSAAHPASGQENWEPDSEVDMDDLPGAAEDDEAAEQYAAGGAGVDADDDGPAEPTAFSEFREKLATLDSWLTIKAALSALRKSDDWRADDKGVWRAPARRMAFDLVEALRAAKKDPVDPRAAPDYFAAWVEFAPVHELQGVWQKLVSSKGYQGLKDEQKDSLADAFEANRSREA